ncbi:helix-turn-helix transcriptional regulator [Sphingobacterium faecium]|uniref:helix-turn-helix transcriptional regulator n=1 Tax=Sphingobacterium faecium TaxID=34087 RepID=UPI00247B00F3|nr:WYL domain-containing protein [Sphingobacterium faecium]WGQ15447.1 WYL domain-containing protein [Sphingobacterium faecium]
MATNKHAIIRYEALDRCLSNRGRKFFIEDLILYIAQAIKDYTGSEASISRRQIFKDIDFMRSEAGFRAPIESYKEGRKTYYRYSNSSYSLAMQQINPVEADLLKTALDMLGRFKGLPQFDFIQELTLKLKKSFQLEELGDYILFDQNEYLKNLDLLGSLLNHIQNKQTLQLSYKSFNHDKEVNFIIHPYFLKQYNKRWFLFGQCEGYDTWTNLPLDRITKFIALDNIEYIPNTDSPDNYFEDLIGVSKPINVQSQFIQIKINQTLWPYIESKPLHPSQKVINKTAEHTTIQLEVIPNYEFYAQIMGFGQAVEVLEPAAIRTTVKNMLEESLSNYQHNKII